MRTGELEVNVRDHGKRVPGRYEKAMCNYCEKIVSGFYRLKHHLAGIGPDVTPCQKVPAEVKDQFKALLLQRKKINLGKEVVPEESTRICPDFAIRSSRYFSDEVQRSIARFFYETGTDFSIVESSNLHSLAATLNSLGKGDISINIPSFDDLRGLILAKERIEMDVRVKEIRTSWQTTGCSILVDGWTDVRGRELINILVDCPEGPVYLRSLNVSAASRSVDAMQLVFEEIISEVGASNVVQIILNSSSPFMKAVAGEYMKKNRAVSWTISSSRCIELMLDGIEKLDHTRGILHKARALMEFIYCNQPILQLVRRHTRVSDLVNDTKVTSTRPFLTLQRIVSERRNLKKVFSSSEWLSSVWASTSEGRRMADLVQDPSFWAGAKVVVKATIPLLRCFDSIQRDHEPQVGFIHHIMYQVKEAIIHGLKYDAALYTPYLTAIDAIWEHFLRHPLHHIAYFLNPRFIYSITDFSTDSKIYSSVPSCIACMVEDKNLLNLIMGQLDLYVKAVGVFGQVDASELSSRISPVSWWNLFGRETPQLQQLAVRVLSQTCDGATRYNLDRSAAEKLLTEGRNVIEQQILKEMTYLKYYFQLDSFMKSCRKSKQVIAETQDALSNGEPTRMVQGVCGATTSRFSTGECSNARA